MSKFKKIRSFRLETLRSPLLRLLIFVSIFTINTKEVLANEAAWEEKEEAFTPINASIETFPLLPNENSSDSRSVGTVTDGYIFHANNMLGAISGVSFFENQNERGLTYTGDALFGILSEAARKLMDKASLPPTEESSPIPLYLGNFSARFGGDIPYSVSHNSGRDGDIAFFVTNELGEGVVSPGIVPFDDSGRYIDPKGKIFQFDRARNWALVEVLISLSQQLQQRDPEHYGTLQYIFISNPLRTQLINYAKEIKRPSKIINEAARLLRQPGGALPHNDHFHIRIHCSDIDARSGCIETGPLPSERAAEIRRLRAKSVAEAVSLFKSDNNQEDIGVRRGAIQRILLLNAQHPIFVKAFEDSDPEIRLTAVQSPLFWADVDAAFKLLIKEKNRYVYAQMLRSLFNSDDPSVIELLSTQLRHPNLLPIGYFNGSPVDLREIIIHWLGKTESREATKLLIQQLGEVSRERPPELQIPDQEKLPFMDNLLNALSLLTNQAPPPTYTPAEKSLWWRMWWKENRKKRREAWLKDGFAQANYSIDDLASGEAVWTLIDALKSPYPYVRWNARQALKRLEETPQKIESWSDHDVEYHWRRWYQKKTKRKDIPPVPERLNVDLHPYEKEPEAVISWW